VREAIFSSLGEWVVGRRVVDLFAGSGALGLEAWSRGAAEVWWVENNPRVFEGLRRNVLDLGGAAEPRLHCVRREAGAFLRSGSLENGAFDLVLLDPPYARPGAPFSGNDVLRALLESPALAHDGWVVLEQSARGEAPLLAGWKPLRERTYGETRIFILTPWRTP
jgi:16S rRNA (guanine966-N2)-methyltransferase